MKERTETEEKIYRNIQYSEEWRKERKERKKDPGIYSEERIQEYTVQGRMEERTEREEKGYRNIQYSEEWRKERKERRKDTGIYSTMKNGGKNGKRGERIQEYTVQ